MVKYKTIDGLEYEMINSNEEMTLGMYCEYLEYMDTKNKSEDEFEIVVRMVEIFSGIPKDSIDLEQSELERLAIQLNFIKEEIVESKENKFKVNGELYMVRQNFTSISTGERKLIREYMNNVGTKPYQKCPILCAVMIRKAIAEKTFELDENGNEISVIKYTQEPLNQLTQDGQDKLNERLEFFHKHLLVKNFSYLLQDFLVSSNK